MTKILFEAVNMNPKAEYQVFGERVAAMAALKLHLTCSQDDLNLFAHSVTRLLVEWEDDMKKEGTSKR
jgi:hypothetical protein